MLPPRIERICRLAIRLPAGIIREVCVSAHLSLLPSPYVSAVEEGNTSEEDFVLQLLAW